MQESFRSYVYGVSRHDRRGHRLISRSFPAPTLALRVRGTLAGLPELHDIPGFDLAAAYRLYSALLEPMRSRWHDERSLLVVPTARAA